MPYSLYLTVVNSSVSLPPSYLFPLSFNNPRSGRSMNIIAAILLFVIYNNAVSISNSLIATGQLSIWIGSWFSHCIFLSVAIYLIYRRSRNLNLMPTFFRKNNK